MAGPIEAIATYCKLLRIDTPEQLSASLLVMSSFSQLVGSPLKSAEWLVFADALEETGECRMAELAQKVAHAVQRREAAYEASRLAAIELEHRAAERRVFSDNY